VPQNAATDDWLEPLRELAAIQTIAAVVLRRDFERNRRLTVGLFMT
jgi:hypothetical protein